MVKRVTTTKQQRPQVLPIVLSISFVILVLVVGSAAIADITTTIDVSRTDPTTGPSFNSQDPIEAAAAMQAIEKSIMLHDWISGGPDYVPDPTDFELDASGNPLDPNEYVEMQAWSMPEVMEYGYQAMVPGQKKPKKGKLLPKPRPTGCPPTRDTGCPDRDGTTICCAADQIAVLPPAGCTSGAQLCCKKSDPNCAQLMCRTVSASGFAGHSVNQICANNNFRCRDATNLELGTCVDRNGSSEVGAGSCTCDPVKRGGVSGVSAIVN